jgi:hypothetical protein
MKYITLIIGLLVAGCETIPVEELVSHQAADFRDPPSLEEQLKLLGWSKEEIQEELEGDKIREELKALGKSDAEIEEYFKSEKKLLADGKNVKQIRPQKYWKILPEPDIIRRLNNGWAYRFKILGGAFAVSIPSTGDWATVHSLNGNEIAVGNYEEYKTELQILFDGGRTMFTGRVNSLNYSLSKVNPILKSEEVFWDKLPNFDGSTFALSTNIRGPSVGDARKAMFSPINLEVVSRKRGEATYILKAETGNKTIGSFNRQQIEELADLLTSLEMKQLWVTKVRELNSKINELKSKQDNPEQKKQQ